jgi:hypothetical protein
MVLPREDDLADRAMPADADHEGRAAMSNTGRGILLTGGFVLALGSWLLSVAPASAGAPGVGVVPGVGAGAPGAGVAPANRGGPVNRRGVR